MLLVGSDSFNPFQFIDAPSDNRSWHTVPGFVGRVREKMLSRISSSWASHLRTTGCHRSMMLTILLAARHKRAHPALTPAGKGWYSIYLPRRDGRPEILRNIDPISQMRLLKSHNLHATILSVNTI